MTSGLVLLFGVVLTPLVQAYSGYGAGTAQNPYIIDSCSQLEEVNDNLAADYTLDQSIDCTTVSNNPGWAPLGPDSTHPFTGTFDGDGNSIYGLSHSGNNEEGIFNYLSGATVRNTTIINPSITGDGSVGGLAGVATNGSVITGITVTGGTIVATDSEVGGIVGDLQNSTLSHSSFQNGTVTGHSISGYTTNVGGVIGYSQNSTISTTWADGTVTANDTGGGGYNTGGFVGNSYDDTVSDSYSTATVASGGFANESGGFAGLAGSSSFARTYASGAVNADNDFGGYVGHIVASDIQDSFSLGAVSNGSSNYGGFIGYANGVSTVTGNDFWDVFGSGQNACIGQDATTGSNASCSGVNPSNNQPNYFFNNHTNAPLSTWNFNTVWKLSDTTPQLITTPRGAGTVHASPGPTSIAVSWDGQTTNGGSPINAYSIKYRAANATQPFTEVDNIAPGTPLTHFTITGLMPQTQYVIYIQSDNALGAGTWQGFTTSTLAAAATDPTTKITTPNTGFGVPSTSKLALFVAASGCLSIIIGWRLQKQLL